MSEEVIKGNIFQTIIKVKFVCVDALLPSQQIFSLSGLDQYLVGDKSVLRQGHNTDFNPS